MLITTFDWIFRWRYSIALFLFWFFLSFTKLVSLRSKIISYKNWHIELKLNSSTERDVQSNLPYHDFDLHIYMAYFVIVLANLILSTISKNNNRHGNHLETVNLLSYLTFAWGNYLVNTGFKRDLADADLHETNGKDKSKALSNSIEKQWNRTVQSHLKKQKSKEQGQQNEALPRNRKPKSSKNSSKDELTGLGGLKDTPIETKQGGKPSLGFCLIRLFAFRGLCVILLKFVHDLVNYSRPILLDRLINFVKDKEQNVHVGFFYIGLMSVLSLAQSVILQHYQQGVFTLGNNLKIGLMGFVYRKSLKLSPTSRKETSLGEMNTLLGTNTSAFEYSLFFIVELCVLPIELAITTYMLWQYLGLASLVGISTMLLFVPLNVYFVNVSKKLRQGKYKLQDSRIKIIGEILTGIRVIKFYGWEESFISMVKKLRIKEIASLMKAALLASFSTLVLSVATFIVGAISFATFILIDEKNKLDANTAFVSLSLMSMLRLQFAFFPHIYSGLINLNVSTTRIRNFLVKEEIREDDISHARAKDYDVVLENANMGWSRSEKTLKNINLKVKKGSLVAVVGKVGSGKSSLLNALLGEMHKLNEDCKINVDGSIGYVPQQAWIQNATVKSNILFKKLYDGDFYAQVVEACSLTPDLEILIAGENTEIGEKGINLSGGQKQRVSLARAVYSNADIYLLDDPLSAVDSHVGKSIFDSIIGPNGLLKEKTRVFVTNSLHFLPQVDAIVMLDDGCIVAGGTFSELKAENSNLLSAFMKSFDQSNAELAKKSTAPTVVFEKKKANTPEKSKIADKKVDSKLIKKEKIETGSVKASFIFEYLKACGLRLSVLFLFLVILGHGVDMSSSFWLSDWSNDALKANTTSNGTHMETTSKYVRLGVYSVLGLSRSLIGFIANLAFVCMLIKASNSLHNKLIYHVLRADLKFFESTPNGRIVNRFTKDIEATEDSIPTSLKNVIERILDLVAALIIVSLSSPLILLCYVPIIIAYILLERYFIPSNRQIKRMLSASRSPVFAHFSESQTGVTTLRAFKLTQQFVSLMDDYLDDNFKKAYSLAISKQLIFNIPKSLFFS